MTYYQNFVISLLATAFLFTWLPGSAISQDTDSLSVDRPYYNNRRPAYSVRRPASNNQRPYASPNNNLPASATGNPSTIAKPEEIKTGTCSSTNSYQQYGICWAEDSQRLQISPDLTIENLVRFHTVNMFGSLLYSTSYRQQLCDQSRRFNSVGLLCVSTGQDDCFSDRGSFVSQSCFNDDCICVVGEPYETIAGETDSPNSPLNAPQFQPGYWQSWAAELNQNIQSTLAAALASII